MDLLGKFVQGFLQVVTVTAAPQLYRYPYRSSSEGLRGDMQRVGKDIDDVFGKMFDARNERDW